MKKYIRNSILFFLLFCFLFSFSIDKGKNKTKFVVVLDAGHGGHDPGNVGNGFKEKEIALKIVLHVGKLLGSNPNIEIKYTRKTDVFIPLKERGAIANKANADLFVSVHCNAHNSSAHGTETFVLGLHANKQNFEVAKKENQVIYLEEDYETNYVGYDINSPESIIGLTIMQEEFLDQSIDLAKRIQDNFTKDLKRVNRGVKQAGFIVLHQTFMPSVLIEAGFLTYKDEGKFLNSVKGQQEVAKSIADAIIDYKKSIEANSNIIEETTKEIEPLSENKKSVSNNNQGISKTYVFKVQLAASTKEIPLKPENFKGLNQLSVETYKQYFRYMYGNTNSYKEALKLKDQAIKSGFTSCYIVMYKNNVREPLTQKIKTELQ